jgi:leucyl-tRNA synthetase
MYNHQEIETKWQKKWTEEGLYKTEESKDKPKYYILDMFPYPSGTGLHVGHPRGYIATDVIARYQMLKGFNVLHPMGWDAFGLPAENYALTNKVHPKVATDANVVNYKRQLNLLGLSYDWSREINTTDPEYYKWTQWAFIKIFEQGLVYESFEPINWCPTCLTGLANEDVEDGHCERCDTLVEKKPMRQWVIRITDYADRLLKDLDKLNDWEEPIKEMQRNWIGRSEGAEINFAINSSQTKLKVFTTRPDTIFGATYLVVCPEHKLIIDSIPQISNYAEVESYLKTIKNKSDLERTDLNKNKTGVELKGLKATNPATGEAIPVFVADYVLPHYGTGAIMAVPAHDERDHEFAEKYKLPIIKVVAPAVIPAEAGIQVDVEAKSVVYTGDGVVVNSDFLNGLKTNEAKSKTIKWLQDKNIGASKVQYKLKDWVFSRQRYWGEPIPLIHCDKCGVVAVPDSELPLKLPQVEHYEPSGTGESPLATITDWVNTTCPKCGGKAKRETNTMPQWAGSSWYYLRYMDPHNDQELVAKDKEKYWSPVDCYVGGAEHATRHLIYARFWHKFLFDIGVVSLDEPFAKLRHVGLILAEDNRKMSKRWNNVINPDEIVASRGADSLRIYEMFMGPFGESIAWNTNGLLGARKFLDKIYALKEKIAPAKNETQNRELKNLLHKTIKKVGDDIVEFKFNTAVSAMMILVNKITEYEAIELADFKSFLLILSPFAPHLSEELWEEQNCGGSIFKQSWPEFDPTLAFDAVISLVVQINGKLRDTIEASADISEDDAKAMALKSEKIIKWLDGKTPTKVICVKGKLVNIVVKN